jgi:hypothetical protein
MGASLVPIVSAVNLQKVGLNFPDFPIADKISKQLDGARDQIIHKNLLDPKIFTSIFFSSG